MKDMKMLMLSKSLGTEIDGTTDLSLFYGYDLEVAKSHMINYGIIYYFEKTVKPLEIEDVENYLFELA